MMKKANNYVLLTGIVAVFAVVAMVIVSMGGMSNDSNVAGEARFTSPTEVENTELSDDGMIECGSCVDRNKESHTCKQLSLQSSDKANSCECPVEDAIEFHGNCKPKDAEDCDGICLYEYDGEMMEKPCYEKFGCECASSITDVNNNKFELVGLEGDCMGPDQNRLCGRCIYEENSLNQPCFVSEDCECPVKDGMAPQNITGDCKPPREENESCGMCIYDEGVEIPCYENEDCVCNEYYTENVGDGADSIKLHLVEITGDCQK
ncbi:MAG: hypothetical protein ACOCU6_01250 [Nanoarchaeota archaeon]